MLGRRFLTAVLAATTILALGSQSAFALGWNGDENGYPVFSGKVGEFLGPSGAEVTCRYNGAGRLRSVTVRPITMWGNYDQASHVGQRYLLREAQLFHAGRLVYRSPIWTDSATKSVAADSFASHRFYVNEDLPGTSAYYVAPVMLWYAKGSSTAVEGRAPVLYDAYLLKRGTESRWSNGCAFDYDVDFGQAD